jgi:hypothetical protein
MKKLKIGLFFIIFYFLSACSSLNEGAIDYRFSQGQNNRLGGFNARYFTSTGFPSSLNDTKKYSRLKKGSPSQFH